MQYAEGPIQHRSRRRQLVPTQEGYQQWSRQWRLCLAQGAVWQGEAPTQEGIHRHQGGLSSIECEKC